MRCKECNGVLVPFYGRLKCSVCSKTYDKDNKIKNKIAYIGGSYNPPHKGHDKLIQRVVELGFKPLVVINSDQFIRDYKGIEPQWTEELRAEYFWKQGYDVKIVDKNKQRELIKEINPSVIVVGTDWMKPEILPQLGIDEKFLTDNNISMLFLPRTPGISSTMLRNNNE